MKADVRLIDSKEFAAQGSLRFPRVVKIRWTDLHWTEVLDGARRTRADTARTGRHEAGHSLSAAAAALSHRVVS